jgi:putative ABC transport system permease protein
MAATIQIAIRALWAHKRRLAGTCFAVFLGVAFLTGTLVLNDTFQATFDRLFAATTAGTDAVVQSTTRLGGQSRALIPASLLDEVRAVPGVADVQPTIAGYGQLIASDGKPLGGNAPRQAGNWIGDPALNPYRLVQGRAPVADDEVVINRGAAKKGNLHLGQVTVVQTPQPIKVTIVGIATFGGVDGFGETTFTAFSWHGAQQHLTTTGPGQLSSIAVRAAPGVGKNQLTARIAPRLPAGVQAVTGTQLADDNLSTSAGQFLAFLRAFMSVFAGIALLVASFSIYNTFAILTAQRTRDIALLRILGASRRQTLASVLAEAAAAGVVASATGLAGGLGIAALLKGAFHSLGFAIPASGLVFRASTAIVAVTVGIGITLLAGLMPALRASRIPPLAALRNMAVERSASSVSRGVVGLAITGVGVIVVLTAVSSHGSSALPRAGLGALLTIVGTVVLGPLASKRASSIIGLPAAAARGLTGDLARHNAMRNPRRTAATAAALMVGVSVVTLFTVFAASLKHSLTDQVTGSVRADLVVSAGASYGGARLSPQLITDLARLPDVAATAGLGGGEARVATASHEVSAADRSALDRLLDLHVTQGSLRALSDTQLAVSTKTARDKHWKLGSDVSVTFPDGTTVQLTVGAIYRDTAVVGDHLLSQTEWVAHTNQPVDSAVFVKLAPGVDRHTAHTEVTHVARGYGDPRVQDPHAYATTQASMVNTFLALVYVMLALSVIIALLGISNTLSLSTHERTRELGLLRAIGETRAQLRSMVRYESIIVALFGTITGLGIGVFLGWALVQAASHAYMTISLAAPASQLITILAVGAAAGGLAAIGPARRAARLNVLTAISAE